MHMSCTLSPTSSRDTTVPHGSTSLLLKPNFRYFSILQDWRVKQMVDTCHIYYSKVWSRGDLTAVDTLLDSQFVYRDLCSAAGWVQQSACLPAAMPPTGMVVGPGAFKALLTDMRSHYPDLYVEVS